MSLADDAAVKAVLNGLIYAGGDHEGKASGPWSKQRQTDC